MRERGWVAAVVMGFVVVASTMGGIAAGAGGGSDAIGGVDADETGNTQRNVQAEGCARTPPGDFADPSGDVLGWEEGLWYGEPIQVNQADGLSDAELRSVISRTMARVEAIRCLEFEERVPVEVINRTEFGRRGLGGNATEALRTFDNAKYEALFLVNESADSLAVQEANSGSNVLGYYDDRTNQIVLISEEGTNLRVDEITLAHELVHAVQDQKFDLGTFDDRLRDEVNAESGLIEGDARYVDYLYRQQCAGAWNGTCLVPDRRGGGGLANIGVYFVKYMPYSDGPPFVQGIRNRGGWEAVNALYDDPPASSEQVIHPEKYGSDPPTNVTLEDASNEQWERVRPNERPNFGEVGEGALAAMFVYPTYHSGGRTELVPQRAWLNTTGDGRVSDFDPINYSTPYTEGWDGEKLYVYDRPGTGTNETAYVWRLAWDSPEDAREFVSGYRRLLDYWGANRVAPNTWRIPEGEAFADAFHVSVDGSTVTITNAPTVDQLSAVNANVEVGNATNATSAATAAA